MAPIVPAASAAEHAAAAHGRDILAAALAEKGAAGEVARIATVGPYRKELYRGGRPARCHRSPIITNFRSTLSVEAQEAARRYREAIDSPLLGVTHFVLHATMPGEIETIAPDHAGWRTREFALFRSGAGAEWCAEAGIVTIG